MFLIYDYFCEGCQTTFERMLDKEELGTYQYCTNCDCMEPMFRAVPNPMGYVRGSANRVLHKSVTQEGK